MQPWVCLAELVGFFSGCSGGDGTWGRSLPFFQNCIGFLKKKILFIFRQRGREGEREREKQCVVASHAPPTGDLDHNPGMCPDWELNWWPFGYQASTQCTSHTSQGIKLCSFWINNPFPFSPNLCPWNLPMCSGQQNPNLCSVIPILHGCVWSSVRAYTRINQWMHKWVEQQIDVSLFQ